MQAEIQYDDFKDYCLKNSIELFGYETQDAQDFINAEKYFTENNVKWVYIGSNSVVTSVNTNDLKVITDKFPTICMFENTVAKGGLMGYVIPWSEVSRKAAEIAMDILAERKLKTRVYMSDNKSILVNKQTAETLNIKSKLEKLGEINYI